MSQSSTKCPLCARHAKMHENLFPAYRNVVSSVGKTDANGFRRCGGRRPRVTGTSGGPGHSGRTPISTGQGSWGGQSGSVMGGRWLEARAGRAGQTHEQS